MADVRDPGLDRHFEGADALIHLAFIVTKRASPDLMQAVNVEGSRRMFRYAIEAGASSIVYSSSVAAYGVVPGQPEPILEDTPRQGSSQLTYSRNKYDVEEILDGLEVAHPKLRVVRLRPGVLVGKRNAHGQDGLLRKRTLVRLTNARLPLVWDEDVADAVLLALLSDVRGAFNLCADNQLEAGELGRRTGFRVIRLPFKTMVRAAPLLSRVGLDADPDWVSHADIELIPSCERAKQELGWKPRCPTATDVLLHYDRIAPRALDRRLAVYFRLVNFAAKHRPESEIPEEAKRLHLTIHMDITGPRGGDYTLSFQAGEVSLTLGIPRPPDATVTLSSETLLALLCGSDDLSRARMTGRMQIRGEPSAGYLMAGFVTTFRAALEKQGFLGWSTRRLSRWFETGERP